MTIEDTISEYRNFLEALKPISRYAVDMSLLPGETITSRRPFEISEEEFFANLYVKRSQEDVVLKELFLTPNTILLIGEKGSGKTSLCINAINEYQKNNPRIHITRIDIRSEVFSDDIRVLEPKIIDAELLEKLRERYLADVFPFKEINDVNEPEKKEIPFLKLIAYLVDPLTFKPRGFENETLYIGPRIWFNQYLNSNEDRRGKTNYYNWLLNTYSSDERVGNYIENFTTTAKLRVQLLMHAAHLIYKYERQCILIDNVDTLDIEQQASIQSVIKRLVPNISQIGNFIMDSRDRGVFKEYEFDETQAPTFITRVRMYTPERDLVPAVQLQKVTNSEIKEIVRRRLDYTLTRFNANVLNDEVCRNKNIPQKFIEKDYFANPISRNVYENILECSNKISEVFRNINGPYFFNNSIRLTLDNYCEFLQYLVTSEIDRIKKGGVTESVFPNFSNYSVRGVTTEYLAWIRRNNVRENSVGFYDVVADKDAWLESGKETIGCSLEHLIITATWNLTIRKPIESYVYKIPKVGEVINKLENIGYKREEIMKAMLSLFHEDDIRTHFIEIQSPDPMIINKVEDIKENFNIYVTPRGKSLVSYLINTFGYTFECVLNHAIQRKNTISDRLMNFRYLDVDEKLVIDFIIPHLCEIAEMHISTLLKFRENVKTYQGKFWFNHYLDDFGVPIAPERKIGRYSNGRQTALQFELMIAGITDFIRSSEEARNKLIALETAFKIKLTEIVEYKEQTDEINFNII